jgi:hypothetical protein
LHGVPSADVVVTGSFWFRAGCAPGKGTFGFVVRSATGYVKRAGMFPPYAFDAAVRFG